MRIRPHRNDDPDALSESLRAIVGPVDAQATQSRGFEAELQVARLPRTGLFTLRISGGRLVVPAPRPFVGITVPLGGIFKVKERRRNIAFRSGTAHVLPPTPQFDFHSGDGCSNVLALAMETSLLRRYLQHPDDEPASGEVRLPSRLFTVSGPGAGLVRTLRYLWRELQRDDSSLLVPRIGREAEELLAALVAEACGATAPESKKPTNGGYAAIARHAEEFIDAQLESVVSLAEVAAAVGTSTKTLSRAFRQRHGMGPAGFLRRRRLEAARRDLAAAEPGATAVSDVALRYGFAHLGRFAGAYREAFGELPSETLSR
ncbi:MAG: AraC family transcriptional regulator [Deltaproteobacteria bacterium]|nr:AraC family transcriptional regulator [Deltaproteobacteria bacterium]MBW2667237.1 AraC family transcriptional regulator [Deltaproteobacteria bacterium]